MGRMCRGDRGVASDPGMTDGGTAGKARCLGPIAPSGLWRGTLCTSGWSVPHVPVIPFQEFLA